MARSHARDADDGSDLTHLTKAMKVRCAVGAVRVPHEEVHPRPRIRLQICLDAEIALITVLPRLKSLKTN